MTNPAILHRESRADHIHRDALDLLCPTETEAGKRAGTTCSSCQFCFRK